MKNNALIGVPVEAIPCLGSPSRTMLDMFLTGDSVLEQDLCDEFGRNYRSNLQRLRGDVFLNWRFIDVVENGVIEARYIDPRHLSGDRNLDALARAERRKELKSESHKEAMGGASRVQVAFDELQEANEKFQELKKENAQQS